MKPRIKYLKDQNIWKCYDYTGIIRGYGKTPIIAYNVYLEDKLFHDYCKTTEMTNNEIIHNLEELTNE